MAERRIPTSSMRPASVPRRAGARLTRSCGTAPPGCQSRAPTATSRNRGATCTRGTLRHDLAIGAQVQSAITPDGDHPCRMQPAKLGARGRRGEVPDFVDDMRRNGAQNVCATLPNAIEVDDGLAVTRVRSTPEKLRPKSYDCFVRVRDARRADLRGFEPIGRRPGYSSDIRRRHPGAAAWICDATARGNYSCYDEHYAGRGPPHGAPPSECFARSWRCSGTVHYDRALRHYSGRLTCG